MNKGMFFLNQNTFFRICSNAKSASFSIVYTKVILISEKIFVLRLFSTDGELVCFSFEQRSVIKFCWLRSANHVKFTEKCVICTEKYALVKKMFMYG